MKILYFYKFFVDWSLFVGFWFFFFYDIVLDRIFFVIFRRFLVNNDVIFVLFNIFRYVGWERFICGEKVKCYLKSFLNNSICLLKFCIVKYKNLINGKYFKELSNGFLVVIGELVLRKSDFSLSFTVVILK